MHRNVEISIRHRGLGNWEEDAGTRGRGDAVTRRKFLPHPPHPSSTYRLATRINKNAPIPKNIKLGNQAPMKGEMTPACPIAPLIKKIK